MTLVLACGVSAVVGGIIGGFIVWVGLSLDAGDEEYDDGFS
jgi:hypothetical protein